MVWRAQMDDRGVTARYKNSETGEVVSAKEYERRLQMQQGQYAVAPGSPQMIATPPAGGQTYVVGQGSGTARVSDTGVYIAPVTQAPAPVTDAANGPGQMAAAQPSQIQPPQPIPAETGPNPLVQPGAKLLTNGGGTAPAAQAGAQPKTLRLESQRVTGATPAQGQGHKVHGFLDATSIAILLPTLVLLAIIVAAAYKKRLFPWQTVKTFNPPSGLMTPREYQHSFLCPPNLRLHGRMNKKNPNATWTERDGIVLPFGFLARTHLPVTIPLGRLPNKNMFIVAPSGSGKTTLMRAIIKAMLAKPCVIIALEAKANDPHLDEKKEGFKFSVLPEAQRAGFDTLYFNPLDPETSIHWNPLDQDPTVFASSIVQDVNSLEAEQQHWAERDFGYIEAMAKLLKWGAVEVIGRDENDKAAEFKELPCNPRGLMELVFIKDNIVESLRRSKNNPELDQKEVTKVTQTLSTIIRSDTDFNNNVQGVRGRLRMFKKETILKVTETSNVDLRNTMNRPTVLIFGAPASLGPDAESLAACFVYQLEQLLHTRYGTNSVLPLFAFFDEYQTLNIDMAGRLSAIVRGANGGLTIILQNISQVAGKVSSDPTSSGASELKTIFSNSAIRICLHNADESTAKFFSDEIGKHAVIIPGVADSFNGGDIFPRSWKRIHSQQVVARIDPDSIKRMEKQHALIFLAPAGDAEFGEVKPLMVDLTGIEEIARLHLLHNVSNRAPIDTPPSSAPNTPPGAPPTGGLPNNLAAAVQVATAAAQVAGAVAASEAASTSSPIAASVATGDSLAPASAPVSATVRGSAPAGAAVGSILPIPPSRTAQAVPAAEASESALRICPHCWQNAGKGRFCIECGREIGQAASVANQAEPAVQTTAPAAQEAPSAPSGHRQPMTSLNPDAKQIAARMGIQPTTAQVRQPANAWFENKAQNKGVEF